MDLDRRRVSEIPTKGIVIIAHPGLEWAAQRAADRDGVPYFLSDRAELGSVYSIDAARHSDPVAWCEPRPPEPPVELG